jgi:pimeloyl-ACP methyl ester carboxylesterase/DNA-binding winged helix-turn-helix (wHTH) protein
MIYAFAGLEVDDKSYEIRRGDENVAVEPQVFDVLVHLLVNRNRVVPKEELLDSVWRTRFVTESTLTTRIKEARRAIGDDGQAQRFIRTVHGRGYRFVGDVVETDGTPAAPAHPADRRPLSAVEQEIRFCRAPDGVGLAYAVVGEGRPLLKAANWLTHLDYDWRSPVWRHWLRELGSRYQLVRYDERGCGLSDRDVDDYSLEAWVRDLEAVADDAGLERFALLGISQGAAVAIAYAVAHPERVSHLVLYGSYGKGLLVGDTTENQRAQARFIVELANVGWGRRNRAFRQVFSSLFMPEAGPELHLAFDELQRRSTSPQNAARFLQTFFQLDVRALAPEVSVPTLVLHGRGDQVWPFEHGRQLAALVPGSRFVPLDSSNHLLLEDEPAWPRFLSELERFVG